MMAGLPQPQLEAAAARLLADGSRIVREFGWLQNAAADAEGRVSAAGAAANAASNWYAENYYPGRGSMVTPVPIPGEYIHNYRMKSILWQARLYGAQDAAVHRWEAAELGEWLPEGWYAAVWAAMNRLEGWLAANKRLSGCPADGGWKPPPAPRREPSRIRSMGDTPTWPRVDWWNDRPERTAGEVERALREAAQPLGVPLPSTGRRRR